MDPNNEIQFELMPLLRVYKNGRVERFFGNDLVPASIDPTTGVTSKDVVIHPETGVSARLYLPKLTDNPQKKLPLLIYYHGGGFSIGTAFSSIYHNYLNSLVSQANIVAVSVDYRLAPEHPVPTAYDDSWLALRWATSQAKGGPEAWLADHADFARVYLAGDSAGANIAHQMAIRAGARELENGVKVKGMVLSHPYFWGTKPVGSETTDPVMRAWIERMWAIACSSMLDDDDPLINPLTEEAPSLAGLGCERVMVCVAGDDIFRERGRGYYEKLGGSGWGGEVQMLESEGEDHCFHFQKPKCEKALAKMECLIDFFNHY